MLVELNNILFILDAQCSSDAKKVKNKCFLKERPNQLETIVKRVTVFRGTRLGKN